MVRLPERVVGDAYANAASWDVLSSLVDLESRMAGHEGERAAIELLSDRLNECGVRSVERTEFEIPAWFRGSSTLSLGDRSYDSDHQLVALPGSPAGEANGELVDVGYGTPEDFADTDVEGRLVIASSGTPDSFDRWLHRREKYDMAVENGAIGFLFRSHVEGCLPPTGDVGDEDGAGEVPAVGVSRELGSRLGRRCEEGSIEAKLSVDCRTERTTSANLSGRLGPETDSVVLVTAHHDAHDIAEGAKDNGCGCALVVELARLLAQVEDELDETVQFTTFGAEEIGLRGSKEAVSELDLDRIEAVLNLDGIGDSRTIGVDTHGFPALETTFETVREQHDVPIEIYDQVNTHSDHWPFAREGVPVGMAYSVGGSDERGWGHTHGDTLDKLDRRDLRDLAVPLASAVLTLASDEVTAEHVDPAVIEQRAREEGYDI